MTWVRLEPAAPQSRVKHSITELLRSLGDPDQSLIWVCIVCLCPTQKKTLGLYGLTLYGIMKSQIPVPFLF